MRVVTDPPIVPKLQSLLNEAVTAGCPVRRIEVNSGELACLRKAGGFRPATHGLYSSFNDYQGSFQGAPVYLVDPPVAKLT